MCWTHISESTFFDVVANVFYHSICTLRVAVSFDWGEVLWPSQLIRVMSSRSVYQTTLFLGMRSRLNG